MGREGHGISCKVGKLLSLLLTLATFTATQQDMPLGVVAPLVTVLCICVEVVHLVELFGFNLGCQDICPTIGGCIR